MKNITTRSIAAVALIATLGVGLPASAYASSAHDNASASIAFTPWTSWHASWVAYFDGIRAINLTYQASLQSSHAAYYTAWAAATTVAERQTARLNLDAALAADINTRVAAITAAGDPPPPPAGYNGTTYVAGIQAANVAYRASVATAQTAFASALASATTTDERRAARLTFEAAVANAVVARSAALLALGTPPSHPGQPS